MNTVNYNSDREAVESPLVVGCLDDDGNNTAKIEQVARLIYKADPFIYPGAFGDNINYAAKVISYFINNSISYFKKQNIYFAECGSKIVGAMVLLRNANFSDVDCTSIRAVFPELPKGFEIACAAGFNTAKKEVSANMMYICSLAVDENLRRRHVGKKMIEAVVARNSGKDISLHVLCENTPAIGLYKACGFEMKSEKAYDGFAVSGERPKFYAMKMKGLSSR